MSHSKGDEVGSGSDAVSLDTALRRAFLTGAVAKIFAVLLSLVAVSVATHALGTNAYGVVAVIAGLAGVFGFLDFGVGNSLVSRLSAAFALKDDVACRRLVTNSFAALAVVGIAVLGVGLLVVTTMPTRFLFEAEGVDASAIRMCVLVYVAVAGVTLPANVAPRMAVALQRGTLLAVVNLASGLSTLFLVGLAAVLSLDLTVYVLAFVGIPALANVGLLLFLIRSFPEAAAMRPRYLSSRETRDLLRAGLPFFVLSLAGAVAYQTDILVVAYVLGASSAAIVGILNRLFSALTLVFVNGMQQLWASVAHADARGDTVWIRRSFGRTLLLTSGIYAAVGAAAVLIGPMLIPVVFGSGIKPTAGMILAFMLWNTYNFAMTLLSFLLNGLGKVWGQAVPALLMAFINLPLSIILAQEIGVAGPVYASLVAHVLTSGWVTVVLVTRSLRGRQRERLGVVEVVE